MDEALCTRLIQVAELPDLRLFGQHSAQHMCMLIGTEFLVTARISPCM